MNKIWCWLLIIGIFISLITGKINNLGNIMIDSSTKAFEIFFQTGILILVQGSLFQIAIDSGMVKRFSNFLKKPLRKIYPELDFESKAFELICSNMVANMLGLGNAATPFGLKTMKSLQELNKDKTVASRSMITFLVINTSGLTIVPTTVISLRMMYGSLNPTDIVFPCFLASFISLIGSILIDKIIAKRSNRL